jgi:hypothetical protein
MKFKPKPTIENEELFKNILNRQNELQKLTFTLIETAASAKQHDKEAKNTYEWLTALKHNNTTLLSKAV